MRKNDKNIISAALEELNCKKHKPWMTVKILQKYMKQRKRCEIPDQETLEKVLVNNSKKVDREIRYARYVSRNSVGSLWVRREIEEAWREKKEPLYIASGNDAALMEILKVWQPGQDESFALENFINSSTDFRGLTDDTTWKGRCKAFMDDLFERLRNDSHIVIHPNPPEEWSNPHVRPMKLTEAVQKLIV